MRSNVLLAILAVAVLSVAAQDPDEDYDYDDDLYVPYTEYERVRRAENTPDPLRVDAQGRNGGHGQGHQHQAIDHPLRVDSHVGNGGKVDGPVKPGGDSGGRGVEQVHGKPVGGSGAAGEKKVDGKPAHGSGARGHGAVHFAPVGGSGGGQHPHPPRYGQQNKGAVYGDVGAPVGRDTYKGKGAQSDAYHVPTAPRGILAQPEASHLASSAKKHAPGGEKHGQ